MAHTPGAPARSVTVSTYRVRDTTGDDLGLVEHPAPNVEPDDVVTLADGREALVTARVTAKPGPFEALLEVAPVEETSESCPDYRPGLT